MGPSGLDSGSIIHRVQDDGRTKLRRGSGRSTGPASCASFGGTVLIVVSAVAVLGALNVNPLAGFVVLAVTLVFAAKSMSALTELLWGAGPGVSVSRHPVPAGERFNVRCTFSRPRNVQELKVVWQGREEAILRGYDDTTFAEPFLRQELVDAIRGDVSIEIPRDAMPSFSGKHARIIWSISVETTGGGISMQADFPIIVLPGRS
jgi:hypothetical protein